MRERQIRSCLQDGITDVDAMVTTIYGVLAGPIHRAACQTVEAHLEKIRDDGRA
jgi:hypothetical protein